MRIIAETVCTMLVLVALGSGCSSQRSATTRAAESESPKVEIECILSMEADEEDLERLGIDWRETNASPTVRKQDG
jgi:hypothetical protein